MPIDLPGYSEIRELGAGASGRVVVARYDATGQLVAAKVLSTQYAADPEFRDRFRREAQILAEVRHPNVVALYGYVESGQPVILMELIDGVGLERVVERGAMDPEAALVVLSGALQGLEATHRAGVVHRDVKPANILVETAGGSHLVDFGVAVRAGQADVSAGTPLYMAPEQWQGYPASPQTDVYAATAVYYQCITGRWPFPAENIDQLRYAHQQAWPDVSALPQPIAQLVLRGMAKDPAQRPATAGAFQEEADRAANAVHGPDWRRRGAIALGGAAGAFAAAFPLALIGGGHAAAAGTLAGATHATGGVAAGGGAGTGASAGAAAAGVGAHSALLIAAAGAIVVVGGAVGALAATHTGPFKSSPTAASVSSSSSRSTSSSSSNARSSTPTEEPTQSSSSSSGGLVAILGVSHNSLFPAATGDTWTYSDTFGGTTATTTETIVSATPVAGGQNVTLQVRGSVGTPITETFLFKDDGEITAATVTGTGGLEASSSGVLFTIPTKDDILAGKSFSNTGTFTVPTANATLTYTSTAVGGGKESVTVPAGTFDCYKLNLTISISVPQAAAPTSITEEVDLAENIGVVRTHSTFGDSVLTASNLVGQR